MENTLKDNIRHIGMRSAVSNYIGKTLMVIVEAGIFILVTKKLMINDYGTYSFLIATFAFFTFFASLGIPYALLRFIPEYIEHGKKDTAISIIRLSLYAITALGVLLIVCSFFTADKISIIFKIALLKKLFPLIVLIGTFYIVIRTGGEILNALFLQPFRNICQVLGSLIKLFSFVFIFQYGLSVGWLLAAIAAVSILQSLAYFGRIYIYFRGVKPQKIVPKTDLRRFSVFSAKEYLYIATAFFWDMSFDIYVITYLLGAVSAGIFNFAASISFFLLHWSPGIVLQSVVLPLFVREHTKRKDSTFLKNIFGFYNKFKAFFAFPAVFGVWLLADKFELIVYQNKFAPAVLALRILAFSVMLQTFTIPMRDIFNVFEKNEFSLYCNSVIIYRVIASFVLIKHFGIIGAAYAYGTSMVIYFLIHLVFINRIIKVH